jgi:tetratricopeptide (TPR) repeat protein
MVSTKRSAAELLHEARAKERAACIPEALQLFEAAISESERTGEKAVLAEALRRLAVVLHHRNESARARQSCKRSLRIAVEIRNDLLAGEALNTMGGLAVRMGEIEQAREYFRQALERGGHSRELRARVELNLGVLANIRGELIDAVTHYERSVESYRATNDEHGCATAYVNLGIVHTDLR